MQKKKGISLIVLVITIIVMIILAGAIVLSLNNAGIIGKANEAVELTDKKQVEAMAQVAWGEAYAEGARTKGELKEKLESKLDENIKSKYIVEATEKGVYVTPKSEWVTKTVDGVPIPKGFVESPYAGENTRAGGLVIYELETGEIDLRNDVDAHESKTTRNQYVWVPVSDLSTNKFERINWHENIKDFEWIKLSNEISVDFWEVTPITDLSSTYVNQTVKARDFVTQKTINEVIEMYDSVATYGGFYIARYEVGLDIDEDGKPISSNDAISPTVYSSMNKAPYNNVVWSNSRTMTVETGGAVELSRDMYKKEDTNYGVVSTLTYGVQWDAVVQWLKDKGVNILDSTKYGNYKNKAIPNDVFNSYAKVSMDNGVSYTLISSNYSKTDEQSHLLTTGATEETRINNIYDIAGNLHEWTMEGLYTNCRALRGGDFCNSGEVGLVSDRSGTYQNSAGYNYGFRLTLYIKK